MPRFTGRPYAGFLVQRQIALNLVAVLAVVAITSASWTVQAAATASPCSIDTSLTPEAERPVLRMDSDFGAHDLAVAGDEDDVGVFLHAEDGQHLAGLVASPSC